MNNYERLIWLKDWYAANRADLQTQPAQVAAIKSDRQVESTIHDLYLALFNKALGGCGSCLSDALIVLIHFPLDRMKQIIESRFKLRSGALLIDTTGKLPDTTSANLTDEIAIAYLRDNINRKDQFEVLPEDLDQILAESDSKPDSSEEQGSDDKVSAEEPKAAAKAEKRAKK